MGAFTGEIDFSDPLTLNLVLWLTLANEMQLETIVYHFWTQALRDIVSFCSFL